MNNNTTIDNTAFVNASETAEANPPSSGPAKEAGKLTKDKKEKIVPLLEAISTTFHLPPELIGRAQPASVFHIIGNTIRCTRTKHNTPLISVHMPDPEVTREFPDHLQNKIEWCEDKVVEDELRLDDLEKKIQRLQQKIAALVAEQEQLS
ncbi:hypothetical protein [Terrimonas ferruginea]|uniref:hypothetical protein n=1 Tax=Terrimonas ferruginea TaxID=249 RepID=UPI00041B9F22|nr:hypothetical protein [Terrimonas ferruginea]